MAYQEFEASDQLEMEYVVAETLGLTVGQLRATMSNDEFGRWCVFLARKAQRRQLGQ